MESIKSNSGALLIRSDVPQRTDYKDYKEFLRNDFYYSCAYCTISEFEGQTKRFTIDHYDPKSSFPALECVYSNLMYACDTCNVRKGTISPSPAHRERGERFFRPDWDSYDEHYALEFKTNYGHILRSKTITGEFSIEFLDLNRYTLRRLRTIRAELDECHKFVAHGVMQLKEFPIDQLPRHIRGGVSLAIRECEDMVTTIADTIDSVLKSAARSPLADPDVDPDLEERRRNRRTALHAVKTMEPGMWRKKGNS